MASVAYEGGGLLIPVTAASRTFAGRLRQSLQEFEKQLKDTENFRIIAMIGGRAYSVEHIAIRGSEMAVIDGPANEAARYRILCHVNALQLVLQVEPKGPDEKRRRIGFLWEDDEEPPTAGVANAVPGGSPDQPAAGS